MALLDQVTIEVHIERIPNEDDPDFQLFERLQDEVQELLVLGARAIEAKIQETHPQVTVRLTDGEDTF